ncbi:DUF2339 domain-containing protein [Sphingomonas sp. HT-1]|uniref:DUF2339 domain-containing protein n=1 Tax=unclassified Sphingomonas TaxID=196159 RepID=UPI00056D466C|nr:MULTISPECIES: DUF2339 domain-containing protein [unclassified Sphingomonas]KTF69866.1 hypothetical protein ATB93_07270 [Sphingomonas sp. WG]
MIGSLLLLVACAGAFGFLLLQARIGQLERTVQAMEEELARLHDRTQSAPIPRPPATVTATTRSGPVPPAIPEPALRSEPQPEPLPEPESRFALPRLSFESLVGGRLPIWIGGVALVLAGFFLVRYSIEQGLLGPAARTTIAALFGIALVAASEAVRRLPATRDDPRLGQALAGAGIASLYGTLYMAAALYHLIAPLSAFVLVLLVTLGAMALSLRHGPPTAVMALVGGFLAPLVAGFDAAGVGPLLVYLGLFVAALFGLAVHRGWGWLAFAASFAGLAWAQFLIAVLDGSGNLSAVGGFTMLLAGGASAALPVAGIRSRWLRLAPLLAGLLQLVVIAPGLEFSALAWSFYLVLAAAALALAWRDATYLAGALASLVLLLALEGLALLAPATSPTPLAAIVATLLFGGTGQWLARRSREWLLVALLGTGGPLLVAHLFAAALLPGWGWGLLEAAAAAACARLAVPLRTEADSRALIATTLATALLATVALAQFVPNNWVAVPLAAALLLLGIWARQNTVPSLFVLPVLPLVAALVAAAPQLFGLAGLVFETTTGTRIAYPLLPPFADLLRTLALPIAAAIVLLGDPRQFGAARRLAAPLAAGLGLMLLYALAKQPLAIATPERFLAWGFVERALITQVCLAAGWALARAGRLPTLSRALLLLGLARIVLFDALMVNPAFVAQWSGPLPLVHLALAAFWCWTLPHSRWRIAAALLTLAAALVAIRQWTHGPILTGPISTFENGGYSAALLGVALAWLVRGITAARHDLRIAGLVLLTCATFKVFLVDAAALDGLLRILSFLGLGVALIAIGWAYSRFLARPAATPSSDPGRP